jgi:hypothetical protein
VPDKLFSGVTLREQTRVQSAEDAFQRIGQFFGFGLTRPQLNAQDFRRGYV